MPEEQKSESTLRRLAIYGGSFSPPHKGHIAAARAFYSAVLPDKMLIMPARIPPHKKLDSGASDRDRLEMCRLAFEDDDFLAGHAEVSDYELHADRVSYTCYTLRHFAKTAEQLWLLIGTDMLLTFEEWKNYREVFRRAWICFAERRTETPEHRAETDAAIARYRERYGARIERLEYDPVEVSSTDLREALRAGGECGTLLPESVRRYIIQNGLYGVKNDG